MRLRRIEAVRFGSIDGMSLGDLSPQLTVVHGPNESGKSSLTALVRHVLFGFPPAGRRPVAPYATEGVKRVGRLVFTDPEGEWALERVDGVRGGAVTVNTLSGVARPDLVAELTSGVDAAHYRIVYGFGLAEMQQITDAKGQEDSLLPKLYAASAGLEVDPGAVRKSIGDAMETLWKKNGSTPALNRMKSERERVRAEVRALEAEAETIRADAAHLELLERDLEDARVLHTETEVRAKRAGRSSETAERLLAEAAAAGNDAQRIDRDAVLARSEGDALVVDPVALAAADAVDVLFEDLSGFGERLASLASIEARLDALDVRLRAAVGDTGWSLDAALTAASDAGAAEEIESARDRLFRLAERLDMAVSARQEATGAQGSSDPSKARPMTGSRVSGLAIVAIGLAGSAAGVALSQTGVTVFGVLVTAVGLLLTLAARDDAGARAVTDPSTRLSAAEAVVVAARTSLDEERSKWAVWAAAHGFGDDAPDPAAVLARYQAARTVRTTTAERADVKAALERCHVDVRAYVDRVGELIAPLIGESPEAATRDTAAGFVKRARTLVTDTRAAAAMQRESIARAKRLESEAAVIRERGVAAAAEAADALSAMDADTLEEARESLIQADADAADAAIRFERVLQEVTDLRARLGTDRRDTALGELRLAAETLSERIAVGVREYAVMSIACHLLALAQERFERERKGPILECAETALAAMTGGRYARISVPMGKDAIEVFSRSSAAISPDDLSRGTAEQLYLALRIGLIEQSGQVGSHLPVLIDDVLVNFSPARAERAARAIADLATHRQVIFFTCHPATADLLCDIAPGSVRLELAPPA